MKETKPLKNAVLHKKPEKSKKPKKPKPLAFISSKILKEIFVMEFEFRKIIITKDENVKKRIAFYHHNGKIDYTEDYKNLNNHNLTFNKEKLDEIKTILGLDYYIYFNLHKDNKLVVYDINANGTFFDYEDVMKICSAVNLEYEEVIYFGEYDEYVGPLKDILIRYDLELPEEIRLFKRIRETKKK